MQTFPTLRPPSTAQRAEGLLLVERNMNLVVVTGKIAGNIKQRSLLVDSYCTSKAKSHSKQISDILLITILTVFTKMDGFCLVFNN
jgi:hypothetical protein